jgi:lipoyl(octanoyl) transferase
VVKTINGELIVRDLGSRDYGSVWLEMQDFTRGRSDSTTDELWFVEHPPVYTQGVSGKAEHVLDAHGIPVVQSNRGGQVTYHGPGQIVAYVLFDRWRNTASPRSRARMLRESTWTAPRWRHWDCASAAVVPITASPSTRTWT